MNTEIQRNRDLHFSSSVSPFLCVQSLKTANGASQKVVTKETPYAMRYFYKIILPIILLCLFSCKEGPKDKIELTETPTSLSIFGEGIISTALYERDLAISPDGTELVYTLGDYKQNKRCLVIRKLTEGQWSDPKILSFSGKHQDIEPFFTQDGDRLFFASNRPLDDTSKRSDYNIWYSERSGADWSEPIALNEHINTDKDEFYPSLGKSGNLYFTATRSDGIGREDIFMSRFEQGQYQIPVPLDTNVNTQVFEFNAYINPGEDLLVFSSYGRKDDLGGGDLYYSKKDKAGNWQKAIHMESPINSDKLDYCPFIDIARNNFYFTSERLGEADHQINSVKDLIDYANKSQNGMGDIYRIALDEVMME